MFQLSGKKLILIISVCLVAIVLTLSILGLWYWLAFETKPSERSYGEILKIAKEDFNFEEVYVISSEFSLSKIRDKEISSRTLLLLGNRDGKDTILVAPILENEECFLYDCWWFDCRFLDIIDLVDYKEIREDIGYPAISLLLFDDKDAQNYLNKYGVESYKDQIDFNFFIAFSTVRKVVIQCSGSVIALDY